MSKCLCNRTEDPLSTCQEQHSWVMYHSLAVHLLKGISVCFHTLETMNQDVQTSTYRHGHTFSYFLNTYQGSKLLGFVARAHFILSGSGHTALYSHHQQMKESFSGSAHTGIWYVSVCIPALPVSIWIFLCYVGLLLEHSFCSTDPSALSVTNTTLS